MITKLSSLPQQPNMAAKNSCNKGPGFKGVIVITHPPSQNFVANKKIEEYIYTDILQHNGFESNLETTGFYFSPERKEFEEAAIKIIEKDKVPYTDYPDMTKEQFEKEM